MASGLEAGDAWILRARGHTWRKKGNLEGAMRPATKLWIRESSDGLATHAPDASRCARRKSDCAAAN